MGFLGGYVPIESTDQCSKFTLTTIVASEHIFHSDSYSNILNKYPSSKINLSVGGHSFFSKPGISLSNLNTSHFYEFVGTDLNTENPSIPYGGSVTMSGSKASKFHHKDICSADKEVANNILQHDAKLGL